MKKEELKHRLIFDLEDGRDNVKMIRGVFELGVLQWMMPDLQTLLDDALRDSDIEVHFVPAVQIDFFYAAYSYTIINGRRVINVADHLTVGDSLNRLFFELCNAALPREQLLDALNPGKYPNRDAFAYAKERCEYASYVRHNELVNAARIKVASLLTTFNKILLVTSCIFKLPFTEVLMKEVTPELIDILNFEEWYAQLQINNPAHIESYRQEYDAWQAHQKSVVADDVNEPRNDVYALLRIGLSGLFKMLSDANAHQNSLRSMGPNLD